MSDSAYDQTPGVDPLLEDLLAALTYIRSRLEKIENVPDPRIATSEILKLRWEIEQSITVKANELRRERVPED